LTGQNPRDGPSLFSTCGDLAQNCLGAIRNAMGKRQIAFLIFAIQSQREDAKRDPIEGFVVHDVLPALWALDEWGEKRSTRQN
jgi:hypothetical protein